MNSLLSFLGKNLWVFIPIILLAGFVLAIWISGENPGESYGKDD